MAGLHDYQWLFILEGLPCVVFSFVTWFVLPDFPEHAKFLTERERQIVIARVERGNAESRKEIQFVPDIPLERELDVEKVEALETVPTATGDATSEASLLRRIEPPTTSWLLRWTHDIFHWETLKATLCSRLVWFFAFLYLALVIPFYSASIFFPAILGRLGVSVVDSNLLTVPVYFFATLVTLLVSWRSDKCGERPLFIVLCSLVSMLGFIGLAIWGEAKPEPGQLPFASTNVVLAYVSSGIVVVGIYPTIACSLSWLTETLGVQLQIALADMMSKDHADHVRMTAVASATATVVAFGNLGGILGPLIYGWSMTGMGTYFGAHIGMVACLTVSMGLAALGKMSWFHGWLLK